MSFKFSKYSKLPQQVKNTMNTEMWNYNNTRLSIIQTSHRNPTFATVNNNTIEDLRIYLQVPNNYKILLTQGGCELAYSAVPFNLLGIKNKCRYVVSGPSSQRAYEEVSKVPGATAETIQIKDINSRIIDQTCAYTYFCISDLHTGFYIQPFQTLAGEIIVADATTILGLKSLNISNYGIVFGAVEYSLGTPGATIVIVRQDLIGIEVKCCHSMLSYATTLKMNSIFNTPNCFSVYVLGSHLKLLKLKGIKSVAENIQKLSARLYQFLQKHEYTIVNNSNRSPVTIVFSSNKVNQLQTALQQNNLLQNRNEANIKISLHSVHTQEDIEQLEKILI